MEDFLDNLESVLSINSGLEVLVTCNGNSRVHLMKVMLPTIRAICSMDACLGIGVRSQTKSNLNQFVDHLSFHVVI